MLLNPRLWVKVPMGYPEDYQRGMLAFLLSGQCFVSPAQHVTMAAEEQALFASVDFWRGWIEAGGGRIKFINGYPRFEFSASPSVLNAFVEWLVSSQYLTGAEIETLWDIVADSSVPAAVEPDHNRVTITLAPTTTLATHVLKTVWPSAPEWPDGPVTPLQDLKKAFNGAKKKG